MGFRRAYIYALGEPDTGAVRYVGQTVMDPPVGRYRAHLCKAAAGKSSMRVHRWIARLESPPLFTVLEVLDEAGLDSAERRWIRFYCEQGADLLNSTDGGTRSSVFRGPFTPEHRAKLSAANKGKTLSPETRAKISVALKGRYFSPEHRARLSAAQTGRPKSATTRAKIAAAHTGKRGAKRSAETRAKQSAAQKGRPGRPWTDDQRAKASASRRGRPLSPAHRAAISAGLRRSGANAPAPPA